MSRVLAAAMLLTVPLLAVEGPEDDLDFDRAVREITAHSGKKPLRIPLLGLVGLVSYAGAPAGAKGLRVAVFEDVNGAAEAVVRAGAGKPVAEVRSRRGNHVRIFARDSGKWVKLLIVADSGRQSVVCGLSLRPDRFARFLETKTMDRRQSTI
ncbi:MAG: hypothetical protein FJX77_17435 [Armatimonadetes bacterium]|nr:hypothetical protein [Armatimonadota bacterium]MBM3734427.1 hypothetical protein [Acidobacteriota bacterium]